MPLPEPILDDLRFQRDLVDEARRRIIRYCPEWTDYNVSDPGITLIELFAWMTEMITYRLNLVPEKNYIRFMDLLGVRLMPANSARTELTFRLSAPLPFRPNDDTPAIVPAGLEVATRATDEAPEVVYTTDERQMIVPPKLTQLRSDAEFNKNYVARMGVEIFYAFSRPRPRVGDTFYLGFDENSNISGHILQLSVDAEETQATGVRRTDPPLVWECSVGNGEWEEVPPSAQPDERDTTGGLNNAHGNIIFYLPLTMAPNQVQGRSAYWLRCRLEQRRKEQGMYSQPPRIQNITAYALGVTTRATHAVIIHDERLGESDGEPGQTFRLQNAPVLELREGETVTVEELRDGQMVPIAWTQVPEFSNSDRFDRHFTLETASGEVTFGPSIRQADGSVMQYGRIPEARREIRFTRYRFGGGVAGNVPAGKIQMLKSAVPLIASVTNLRRAEGGRDQETLDEAKMRARREVRAQERAVTADDYAVLAKGASRAVARVKCVTPAQVSPTQVSSLAPGMLELLVVPAVFDAMRNNDPGKLALDPMLARQIETHLDPYRLLTTTVHVREPRYVGVKVNAEVVATDFSDPEVVRANVRKALNEYISPLDITDADKTRDELLGPRWDGWPFGRALFVSELYALIQRVPGVKHVLEVKLGTRDLTPKEEIVPAGQQQLALVPIAAGNPPPVDDTEKPLILLKERRLEIPADTLLCSLDHDVQVVEL